MITDRIAKIRANISIFTNRKSGNILDGSYKSIYKGRSMNFEDLREYVLGDNVKDIDWKASARSGSLLVRQFIAEKKHNIMIVMDTGRKMLADSDRGESKKELAIMSAGTIAYVANQNGDYVGSIYNKQGIITYFPFKQSVNNIERILSNYENDIEKSEDSNIEKALDYILKHIKKRMIIFVVTDIDGLSNVGESMLKRLMTMHDVLFVNIADANITGDKAFDVENELYIPKIIFKDKKLKKIEEELKSSIYKKSENSLKKHGISMVSISSNEEIPQKVMELLERHKYANIR